MDCYGESESEPSGWTPPRCFAAEKTLADLGEWETRDIMNRPKRILVVPADRSVGEAVRALPAWNAIRRSWPETHLAVGFYRETQQFLLQACAEISELVRLSNLKVNAPKHFWRTTKRFLPVLRAMWGYDTIVLLHLRDSHWPMALLARATGARVFDKRVFGPSSKSLEFVCANILEEALQAAQIQRDVSRRLPALHLAPEDTNRAEEFLASCGLVGSKTVFVNWCRASRQRGWGLSRYISLAAALRSSGAGVLMHEKGGPDEKLGQAGILYKEEFTSLRQELDRAGVVSAGKTSMRELMALIDRCAITVGEPSGPTWIAAALGKPTVTIAPNLSCSLACFLPSVRLSSGVHNTKHIVLIDEECQELPEDAVASIVVERLSRLPSEDCCDASGMEFSRQTVLVLNGVEARTVGLSTAEHSGRS